LLAAILASAPAGAEQGSAPVLPAPGGLRRELGTEKPQVYLQEPLAVTVTLLADSATVRDIEYPRLKGSAFTLAGFGLPRQEIVVHEGRDLTSYRFTTTLTPMRSGTLQLGPAELRCQTMAPAGGPAAFFGGTEARPVTLSSAALPLIVLPLPAAGRPADFSGAVGRFTISRTVTPTAVRAGDPVTVRTLVRGAGNLEAFSCKSITAPGLRSYPPRAKLGEGGLACEQVLIPETPTVREIPAAGASFFDPEKKRYQTATSGPVPLRVSAFPAPAPPAPAPPVPLRLAAPILPATPASQPVIAWPALTVVALSLAAGLAFLLLFRRRRLGQANPAAVENGSTAAILQHQLTAAKAALATGDAETFYTALFRASQTATGNRLSLPAAGITGPLPDRELSAPVFQSTRHIFQQCDRVRYGGHRPDAAEMAADLQNMLYLMEIVPCPDPLLREPSGTPPR